ERDRPQTLLAQRRRADGLTFARSFGWPLHRRLASIRLILRRISGGAMNHRNPISVLVLALVALTTTTAFADVTTEQKVSLEGVGPMALANMSGTSKTAISGNRSHRDSDLKVQSKLVRFLARNKVGPTAEIVLLDADKMYRLNMNRKE